MKKLFTLSLTLALCLSLCPTVPAAENSAAFPDLALQSSAVQQSIAVLADKQVLTGYDDGTFRPEQTITRGEFAILLTRLAGLDTESSKNASYYSDVSGYCKPYINAVTAAGLMRGVGGNQFKPGSVMTQQEVATALLRWAGLKDSQLGSWPADYSAMAENIGMGDDITYTGSAAATRAEAASMAENTIALYDTLHADTPSLYFHDGQAQPIFDYDEMIREVVYVETKNDTDGDGKKDLVQVLIQRPVESDEGMQVAAIYEARPYSAGVTDAYDYDSYNAHIVNAELNGEKDAAPASSKVTAGETGESMTPAEDIWETTENVDAYDYWLVRGYAYVSCSGLGTAGSEGIETCGSEEEVSAYASVIDWINGRAAAYTDRTRTTAVSADWATGNVAMSGQSYAGTTAFAVAATGVDGLKTIVPRAGIASWYDYYRSQGTPAGGLYYPGDDCDILADYCMSRLNNVSEDSELATTYANYLQQMIADEDRCSGDYNSFWDERNYAAHSEKLSCSALIVHGLNDFNVRTKQFDMMYDAFESAGCTAKLILHQGAHYTPEQIEGLNYDEILGRWYAHYLYGVDNGAENDPTVRIQSNTDQSWNTYDSWGDGSASVTLNAGSGTSAFTSDLTETGFDTSLADQDEAWIEYAGDMSYAWEDAVISGETNASAVYTFDVSEDLHISGTPTVTVRAAADQSTGILSAMLVDLSEDGMSAVMLEEYSEGVATETAQSSALWYGAGLANKDLLNFSTTETDSKIITRGWMDICNRTSAAKTETVVPSQYYTYTLELQPMDYTVKAGHKLALVLYSTDVEVTYWPAAVTNYTVDNSGTSVTIPTR